MIISEISLLNFRNYCKIKLKLNKKINIIIGNNAEGKTNILESIYFLSVTKSYRTTDEKNLINVDKENTKVNGKIKINKIIKNMTINLDKKDKKVFINNNQIKKISDYITNLNTVLIVPEDINIIKDSPGVRRNFLNISISQISKKYIEKYNEFSKILKMRNDYLKMLFTSSFSDKRYFDIITENLIDREIYIYQERLSIISKINEKISKIYKDISNFNEINILYEPSIDIDFKKHSEYELKEILKEKYNEIYDKEINLGMTILGPHRDDFKIVNNNKDLKYYGSQGQQKLSMIAVKLSILYIYKEKTGEFPVLLMDDIFSELDKAKKNKLVNYINDIGQVIITTNDIKDINKNILKTAKIFNIKNKKIVEKGDTNEQ